VFVADVEGKVPSLQLYPRKVHPKHYHIVLDGTSDEQVALSSTKSTRSDLFKKEERAVAAGRNASRRYHSFSVGSSQRRLLKDRIIDGIETAVKHHVDVRTIGSSCSHRSSILSSVNCVVKEEVDDIRSLCMPEDIS